MAAGVNKEKVGWCTSCDVVRAGGGTCVRGGLAGGEAAKGGWPWYELALVGEKRKKNHH